MPSGASSAVSSTSTSASALISHAALGLSTLVIGYWLGVGRALFGYDSKAKSRRAEDDEDDEETSDDSEADSVELTHEDREKMNALKAGFMEECKLVLLVRTDLKMDKGKMAAQCSHATLACYKAMLGSNPQLLKHWERIGQAKVALKCPNEEEMSRLEAQARKAGLCAKSIRDAGRTQVAAGSKTVLGIGPGPVKIVDQITGHLKLL